MKLLRTVGTRTPYKAVAFFTAEPSKFHWRFENDENFVLHEGHLAITLDTGERYENIEGLSQTRTQGLYHRLCAKSVI